MAKGRPILSLVALILVAGGLLLDIFVILSGVRGADGTTPIYKIFFLEANTAGIGSSPTNAAWTYFSLCDYSGGRTSDCGKAKAAFPFDPVANFGTSSGVPTAFIDNAHEYYYLSRFAWAFYIVSLFFGFIALCTGLLALCTRIGAYLSGLNAFLAMFFQALTAALMTAWTVKARNVFRAASISASLGKYAYGFTWAAFACFFLAMILFCAGGSAGREKKQSRDDTNGAVAVGAVQTRPWYSRDPEKSWAARRRKEGIKEEYSTQPAY